MIPISDQNPARTTKVSEPALSLIMRVPNDHTRPEAKARAKAWEERFALRQHRGLL